MDACRLAFCGVFAFQSVLSKASRKWASKRKSCKGGERRRRLVRGWEAGDKEREAGREGKGLTE